MARRPLAILTVAPLLGACSQPPRTASFDSVDPVENTMAIERAAESRDLGSIDKLVSQLDSSDPAIRLVAIAALRELTGQDLGFNPADAESDRLAAIERWENWVRAQRDSGQLPPDTLSAPSGASQDPSARTPL